MVLSLSVPSFSRSTTSPPPSSSSSSSSSSSKSNNHSATITEALRNNPFGVTLRSRSITTLPSLADEQKQEQEELNNALETLAHIFTDVKIEVFRELLVRFDGDSRLHVCVEQLLRHKEKWVAGRWNVPAGTTSAGESEDAVVPSPHEDDGERQRVPQSELFRTPEYKATVKVILVKEFSGLSKSTVDAVLAEVNFCYIRARPILRDLSKRTWRATFNSILPSFRSKKDKQEHPLILWQRQADGEQFPSLKDTGCEELDRELYRALLAPLLDMRRAEQVRRDRMLAEELNETEARVAESIFECECCLEEVTFERISACSDNMHIICYGCIQRTAQEAIFGQGWGKSVDVEKSTLRCIAPFADGCEGVLNSEIVKQAILLGKAGSETYAKFEGRLASDALLKSQLKLIRCPFCSYAEVDAIYHPSPRGIPWHFRREGVMYSIFMTVFLLDLIPLLAIPVIILYLVDSSALSTILHNALLSLCLKVRLKRFDCANPACKKSSCMTCEKPWRDPHVCYEPLLLDLRATVEAARTAAVKRTCPRCGLSFVKSSGCNKLTCVCGYSMCYLCRKGLGPPLKAAPAPAPAARGRPRQRRRTFNQENINPRGARAARPRVAAHRANANEDEPEEVEGYRHFCEHFRLAPGSKCSECTKCELYQDEDEETVARRAGEKAERDWHVRQGMTGVGASTLQVNEDITGPDKRWTRKTFYPSKTWTYWTEDVWEEGQWMAEGQALVEWIAEQVIVIDGM